MLFWFCLMRLMHNTSTQSNCFQVNEWCPRSKLKHDYRNTKNSVHNKVVYCVWYTQSHNSNNINARLENKQHTNKISKLSFKFHIVLCVLPFKIIFCKIIFIFQITQQKDIQNDCPGYLFIPLTQL